MSTQFKLLIARLLYKILKFFNIKEERIIIRSGINYKITLREGIDLSLFLFGSFQKHVFSNKFIKNKNFSVIFDIGANIGAITLPLAKHYRNAVIYAFEPTKYAHEKLKTNIELNPNLKNRIKVVNAFVSNKEGKAEQTAAYSSWKVDGSPVDHPIHGGILQEATDIQVTVDSFVKQNNITKVDFIKIDVDGHEFEILEGAEQTLINSRPFIIFEFMGHTNENMNFEFQKYFAFLNKLNYKLIDSQTSRELLPENIQKLVPPKGGIDILCLPK